MPKAPLTLTTEEAVKRLDQVVGLVADNLLSAIQFAAVLEAGNERARIFEARTDVVFPGVQAQRLIQHGLMLNLALTLSRLFDPGNKRRPEAERDVASIPMMLWLVDQPGVVEMLVDRATAWTTPEMSETHKADVLEAVAITKEAYSSFMTYAGGDHARNKLRSFRDHLLAHTLTVKLADTLPTYGDLFLLERVAIETITPALIAVNGTARDFDNRRAIDRRVADAFWSQALAAVASEDGVD